MSQADVDSANTTMANGEADALAFESIQNTNNTSEFDNLDSGDMGDTSNSATIEDRIASVGNAADYEAMMADIQSNPNKYNTSEQDPNLGEYVDEQAEAAKQQSQEQDSESHEDSANSGEKYAQFRLRPTDEVDAEAMRIKKAADLAQAPISLTDALAIAKRKLGIKDVEAQPQTSEYNEYSETPEEEADPYEGISYSDAKQEIKELRKRHSQALRDGDLDEAADIMDQLSDTEDLLEVLAEKETFREQNQRKQNDSAFNSSVDRATEMFPDFMNTESEFYQRCQEIDQALQDTGDPRFYDPDKPLLVARMAAKELDVAPGRRATQTKSIPQQRNAAIQPPRVERPGQLPAASGASRTSGVSAGAAVALADQIASISSTEAFERLAQKVHAATR